MIAKFLIGFSGVVISIGAVCIAVVLITDVLGAIVTLHIFSDFFWTLLKAGFAAALLWVAYTAWPIG